MPHAGLATPNAPQLSAGLSRKVIETMVARDSQRFEALDDLSVEPSLGFDGATGAVHHY
jgi:hypothetical protein